MAGKRVPSQAKPTAPIHPPEQATIEDEEPLVSSEEAPLDPRTSARRYWRDPHSGTQREVWRPGDGDGDIEDDHFERKGPAAPLGKRWRLYQLSPGTFKARINEPPSNVILDDRAVHEILTSNIPRAQLSKRWSHDFSGQANVRHRRPHRGRPAYKNEHNATSTAENDSEKYHTFKSTPKVAPYPFSGEKDFTPVFYAALPPDASPPLQSTNDEDESPPKPKHHNQYTSPELLVRNGAQSASQTKGKYRARVNTFLRRSPSPPWVKDRSRLFGGVGIARGADDVGAGGSLAPTSGFGFSFASAPAPVGGGQRESMWVAQDEDDEGLGKDEGEGEEDVMLPSIFDSPVGVRTGRHEDEMGGGDGSSRAENPLKRPASAGLFSSRKKALKEMGYIERLAAGLLEEDVEAARSGEQTLPAAAMDDPMERSAAERVEELEQQLEAATSTINERDQEIEDLKGQLEEMQMRMAMERSME